MDVSISKTSFHEDATSQSEDGHKETVLRVEQEIRYTQDKEFHICCNDSPSTYSSTFTKTDAPLQKLNCRLGTRNDHM